MESSKRQEGIKGTLDKKDCSKTQIESRDVLNAKSLFTIKYWLDFCLNRLDPLKPYIYSSTVYLYSSCTFNLKDLF